MATFCSDLNFIGLWKWDFSFIYRLLLYQPVRFYWPVRRNKYRKSQSFKFCCTNIFTRGPWATMLTWVNSYKSLIQQFRLSVAMATYQNVEFVQLLYAWWRTTKQTFIKTFCQNTCSEIAIKTYFHFLITSQRKLYFTIATKAHEQWQ